MATPTLPPEVANVRGLKPPPFSSSPDPTHPRLSMSFTLRLPLSTLAAIVTGFSLGLSHGAITSGLRFRAENAHRLPTTSSGWFLYHKSKNYNVMLGGIKEGAKMGMKLGLLVGGFCATEEAVDRVRGGKDAGSTVVAGGTVAGIWSLWNQFPYLTAASTARKGLVFGLCFGLVQDGLNLARGGRVGYVEFARRRLFGRKSAEQKEIFAS